MYRKFLKNRFALLYLYNKSSDVEQKRCTTNVCVFFFFFFFKYYMCIQLCSGVFIHLTKDLRTGVRDVSWRMAGERITDIGDIAFHVCMYVCPASWFKRTRRSIEHSASDQCYRRAWTKIGKYTMDTRVSATTRTNPFFYYAHRACPPSPPSPSVPSIIIRSWYALLPNLAGVTLGEKNCPVHATRRWNSLCVLRDARRRCSLYLYIILYIYIGVCVCMYVTYFMLRLFLIVINI